MLLTKRGHDFPVLNSFGCFIDSFFPGKPFLFVRFLESLNDLFVFDVDCFFWIDAKSFYRAFANGTFQLNPVDPNRGRGAVTVLPFVTVEFPREGFSTSLRLAFLDTKFAWCFRSDHKSRFDDFRIFFGASDLEAANGLA